MNTCIQKQSANIQMVIRQYVLGNSSWNRIGVISSDFVVNLIWVDLPVFFIYSFFDAMHAVSMHYNTLMSLSSEFVNVLFR